MKIIFQFVILLVSTLSLQLSAQLPDGATAPDFTIMDINGTSHNLYDVLESGKSVVIDFSATWCGICWNYHSTGALENVYSSYGPAGTDELEVFWIDADANTNTACVTNSMGCNNNTSGDWTAGSAYTYFNLEGDELSVKDDYDINSFPTIIGITSNKKQYEIGKLTNLNTWQSWVQETFALDYTAEVGPDYIDLTTIAGSGDITYEWSNGETTEDISGLAEGFYSCTITEGRGHTVETISYQVSSSSVSIVCPPTPDILYCRLEEIPESLALLDFFEAGGDIVGQYDATSYSVSDEQITDNCPLFLNRTYSVTDLSGNIVSCIQQFVVDDEIAPEITLNLPSELVAQEDLENSVISDISQYIEEGFISDECGISVESFVMVSEESSNTLCELITRTYTIADYCENTSSFIQELYVELDQNVTASFSSAIDDATVDFTSTSELTGTYLWTFGDGNTSTLQDPSHVYTENGLYTVCFEITSPCGVRETCKEIEISDITALKNEIDQIFTISPNPSTADKPLLIRSHDELKTAIWIFATDGSSYSRQIKKLSPTVYHLIIEDLSSGLYYVQLQSKFGQISTQKLLIL